MASVWHRRQARWPVMGISLIALGMACGDVHSLGYTDPVELPDPTPPAAGGMEGEHAGSGTFASGGTGLGSRGDGGSRTAGAGPGERSTGGSGGAGNEGGNPSAAGDGSGPSGPIPDDAPDPANPEQPPDPGEPPTVNGGTPPRECGASQVPIMTAPNAPSGSVRRSGVYSPEYESFQAFDGNNDSMWISGVFQTPAWIEYEWADGPRTIKSYAIHFVNGTLTSRAPRDFTLQGWNGSSWVVVDTRTGETSWRGIERRSYTVASPGWYSKYRWHVTDDNDGRAGVVVVSLGRLELLGCQ